MVYPKFHGITLAANSVIENLHFERLAADPTPVTAGRVWVNTTDKKVKFSGLDATGAVVVHSFSSAAELTAALTEAKAYTDTAITNLKGVAPELLDTLGEIATALNNDPDVYNTLVAMIGTNVANAKAELRGEVSEAYDTLAELETGLTAEVTARTAAVAAEVTARTAADTALQNSVNALQTELDGTQADLAAESAARAAADTALDGRVTTMEGQVNGKIGDLSTLTTTEKGTVVGALNEVDADLAAEVTRAQAAETALQTALAAEATARAAADGSLSALTTTAKDNLVGAINEVDADLAAEVAARAAADTALQSALNGEITRAQAAEAALQTELDGTQDDLTAEVTRAQAAEGVLTTNLAAEVAARTAAVSAEATARADADTAEAAARATADSALQTAINGGKFVFTASAAALTHTVTHNLNTSHVLVQVMVEGEDLKYRNEIVAVEETSANAITVGLTESRKIKVSVMSMAAIAAV